MDAIQKHLSQVSEGMTLLDQDEILQVIRCIKLVKGKAKAGTLYLFGNGGSHTTASHFANDLHKIAKVRAVCVGDLTPVTMAYGNDLGWESMFSAYLQRTLKSVDGVIGFSCGGNSQNVIRGLQAGKVASAITIGFTGMSNSTPINDLELSALVHARVPDIRVQEDLHLMACHAIVRSIQEDE